MDVDLDSTNSESVENLLFDSTLIGAFVAQEIEFLLPDVIQSLEIPIVLHSGAKQRLEFSLQGQKGFRKLPKAGRIKAVSQLKDHAFANLLRSVQQVVVTRAQANSSSQTHLLDFTEMELTNSEPRSLILPKLEHEGRYQARLAVDEEVLTSKPKDSSSDAAMIADAMMPGSMTDVTVSSEEKERIDIIDVPKIPIELQEPIDGRDIRGLTALLRHGRIVAFVEDVAGQLVGENIEKIEVPKKKVFANLALDTLMPEYHRLCLTENLSASAHVKTELRLMDGLLVALENDAQWSRINTRRFHLITKKHTLGLSPVENEEFEKLDALAERRMYSALELPFAELAMLEVYAASVGLPTAA